MIAAFFVVFLGILYLTMVFDWSPYEWTDWPEGTGSEIELASGVTLSPNCKVLESYKHNEWDGEDGMLEVQLDEATFEQVWNKFSQSQFEKFVPPDKLQNYLIDRILSGADLAVKVNYPRRIVHFYLKKQSHRIAIFSTSF